MTLTKSQQPERQLPRPDPGFPLPAPGSPGERTASLLAAIAGMGRDGVLRSSAPLDLNGVLVGRPQLRAALTEPHPSWWDSESEGLNLRGAELRSATLTHAILSHSNLRGADLTDAVARSVDLTHAVIEQANFSSADCGGALFNGTKAGEARFEGAMLEDAHFENSSLRYANLSGALIDGTNFTKADLWGAILDGAEADEAVFRRARLDEASLKGADCTDADFTDASLKKVGFDGAKLQAANFVGARLEGASLRNADLSRASLPRVNLSSCDLVGVRLAGAWLENTRMRVDQFGGALGEEIAGDYLGAQQAYIAVEQNFRSLGDSEGVSWAFRKRRISRKAHAGQLARSAWRGREFRVAMSHGLIWASDVFVEWLCDYGESLWRVVRAFISTIVGFAVFYGVTGSLTRAGDAALGGARTVTRNPLDLFVFSFMNMMSTSAPEIGIKPITEVVFLLASLQGALGIVLIGLFGYVLGNRMNR